MLFPRLFVATVLLFPLVQVSEAPESRVLAGGSPQEQEQKLTDTQWEVLIERLKSQDEGIRGTTAEELGKLGKQALPWLIKAMDDPHIQSKVGACIALHGLGKDAFPVLPTLVGFLDHVRHDVRGASLATIGQIGRLAEEMAASKVRVLWVDKDPFVRRLALIVSALIEKDPGKLISQFLKALEDPIYIVRGPAVLLLAEHCAKEKGVVFRLVQMYSDPDRIVKNEVRNAFKEIGKVALPTLFDVLSGKNKDEESKELKRSAIQLLALIRPVSEPQIAAIIDVFKKGEGKIGKISVRLLRALKSAAIPKLLEVMDRAGDDHALVARVLVVMTAMAKDAVPAIQPAMRLLESSDETLRYHAAMFFNGLGKHSGPAFKALRRALSDESARTRGMVIQALGRIGPDAGDAVPDLIEILKKSKVPGLKESAALSLADIGEPVLENKEDLLGLLEAEDSRTRVWTAYAVARLHEYLLPLVLKKLEQGPSARLAEGLLEAVGQMKTSGAAALPLLIKFLDSPDTNLRLRAAIAIGRVGLATAQAVEKLTGLLGDTDETVQIVTLTALGTLGRGTAKDVALQKKLLAPILAKTRSKSKDIAYCAVEALGMLRTELAIPVLMSLLEDRDMHIRWRAAAALGELGDRAAKALAALQRLFNDPSTITRRYAVEAVEKIRGQ